MTREELLAKKRAYAKAKYYERKAKRVCYDCEQPLTPVDGVRCEFCHDLDAERQRVYRQKESHKRADRKRGARRRAKHREAGLCQFCSKPSGEYASCDEHRARALAATKAWAARKKQGITRLPVRRAPIVDPSRLDETEQEQTWTDRVLRQMRFFDWVTSGELCEAFNIEDPQSRERNTVTAALLRCVKYGWIEKRQTKSVVNGAFGHVDYRITATGREQLKQRRAA